MVYMPETTPPQKVFSTKDYGAEVVLTGTLHSIAVENTKVLPGSIRVNLFSKGRLQVDVKGL